MPEVELRRLPIEEMHERHPGLPKDDSGALNGSLKVCLDRHHISPQEFLILDRDEKVLVEWEPADDETFANNRNDKDATEDGAYACILAVVELTEGLVSLGRSSHGSGADFYVAPRGSTLEDLDSAYRLEISGTDTGSPSDIRYRLAEKVEQLLEGDGGEDGIAGVVGFKERLIRLERVKLI